MLPSFDELYDRFRRSDETTQIEAKRTEKEIGESILRTIAAFANEPGCGGGYLLLGVSRTLVDGNNSYEISGLPNPDKIQTDLANQCAGSFNVSIRPEIGVHVTDDGKRIVVAHIPESDASEKPVYFKKAGLPKGAFRRIGSADVQCTDADLSMLYGLRGSAGFDDGIIRGATLKDLDRTAIRAYRDARAELNPLAEELKLKGPDLLVALGAVHETRSGLAITRAGLLLFGKPSALRKYAPSARVDYVIIAGQHWVPDDANRYRSVEMRSPLVLAIPKLVEIVVQDLPTTFQLKGRKTRRKEIPAIPYAVIREAIVNAVMHRSYRVHSQIQIRRFSNRVEIWNPGYSLVPSERLGQPGSLTRNPRIADVLHDAGYAETKGTGIRVMRKQMHDANLTAPIFSSTRDEDTFQVTLLTHHLLDPATVDWLGTLARFEITDHDAKALIIARATGWVDNATYRNINAVDVLTASKALQRLRDVGLLESHNRGVATYYTLADAAVLSAQVEAPRDLGLKPALSPKDSQKRRAAPQPLQLSPELVGLLRRIGSREAQPRLIEIAILKLCGLRESIRADELARYIKRSPMYLRKKFLKPMVNSGVLRHLYPQSSAHPLQAYILTARLYADVEIPLEAKPTRKTRGQQKLF